MALTNCEKCGEQVSSSAKKCPHCGADGSKSMGGVLWMLGFLPGWIVTKEGIRSTYTNGGIFGVIVAIAISAGVLYLWKTKFASEEVKKLKFQHLFPPYGAFLIVGVIVSFIATGIFFSSFPIVESVRIAKKEALIQEQKDVETTAEKQTGFDKLFDEADYYYKSKQHGKVGC